MKPLQKPRKNHHNNLQVSIHYAGYSSKYLTVSKNCSQAAHSCIEDHLQVCAQ